MPDSYICTYLHVSNKAKKKKLPPTAKELQILLAHIPKPKFATHLLLAVTQEKYGKLKEFERHIQYSTKYLKLYIMRFIDKKQKLDYLIDLIEKEDTGNADRLCSKICVSKSTLKRYLNELRELGYQVVYDPLQNTYCFISKPSQQRYGR